MIWTKSIEPKKRQGSSLRGPEIYKPLTKIRYNIIGTEETKNDKNYFHFIFEDIEEKLTDFHNNKLTKTKVIPAVVTRVILV